MLDSRFSVSSMPQVSRHFLSLSEVRKATVSFCLEERDLKNRK